MNVFYDQRFVLRRRSPTDPLGERLELSFAELMALPEHSDTGLRFDYPIEYLNVAALGLCAALAQALFEPGTTRELIERLEHPMDPEEVNAAIERREDLFTIDGPSGTRFMQGKEPPKDKKGRYDASPLWSLLLTVKKGDKYFLNRPEEWAVRLDQIPLLLFSRATFFEKSAGRGYLTGTSGDLEVRTFPIDPSSLRRTIWLNVLARSSQKEGEYLTENDQSGYRGLMWHDPPKDHIQQGTVALISGLFWMVANAFIVLEDLPASRPCMVSGTPIEAGERAGTGVVISATGIGYGVTVKREKGPDVRQSFFRHPNAPHFFIQTKEGQVIPRHFSVSETAGMIGNMGGLFYASTEGKKYQLAPVVQQLYRIRDEYRKRGIELTERVLSCFGFHMLSSKQNIHGGYEFEMFRYPIIGRSAEQTELVLEIAQQIMEEASADARAVENILINSIQRCTMIEMKSEESEGTISFSPKSKLDGNFIRDIARDLWNRIGVELRGLLTEIGRHDDAASSLEGYWMETGRPLWRHQAARIALDLFTPIFNDYSDTSLYLIPAHNARRYFFGRLRKELGISFARPGETEVTATTTESTS